MTTPAPITTTGVATGALTPAAAVELLIALAAVGAGIGIILWMMWQARHTAGGKD